LGRGNEKLEVGKYDNRKDYLSGADDLHLAAYTVLLDGAWAGKLSIHGGER
jgi:hypothetical protein